MIFLTSRTNFQAKHETIQISCRAKASTEIGFPRVSVLLHFKTPSQVRKTQRTRLSEIELMDSVLQNGRRHRGGHTSTLLISRDADVSMAWHAQELTVCQGSRRFEDILSGGAVR